jgi:mannose-6-phosphate isomerase-like protein (cupin superfamily)
VFVSDEEVEPLTTQLSPTTYHMLWRGDAPPVFPNAGTDGPNSTYFPPVGGFRFFIYEFPPGDAPRSGAVDLTEAMREMEEKLPGMIAVVGDTDDPGMHQTDTLDLQFVLSGELTLELDGGAEKVLRPGDVNIQNGTRHRWHNRGTEPVRVLCAVLGASRRG